MTFNEEHQQWEFTKNFKFGFWEFKFQVDDDQWVTSPHFKTRVNSQGHTNNYVQVYPERTEDYIILENFHKNNTNFLKVSFQITEWSIKAMIEKMELYQLPETVSVEISGDWDKWSSCYQMTPKMKDEDVRVWSKELIVEEKELHYKFKINGQWILDPFRRLAEEGNFKNHLFDPFQQEMINQS